MYREPSLEVGIHGQLLRREEIANVSPLENGAALANAGPTEKEGKISIDQKMIDARRSAMVKMLPKSGLAVIVLGGSHDLGLHLGDDVLYLRVTPKGYPQDSR